MRTNDVGIAVPDPCFRLPLRHIIGHGHEIVDADGITVAPTVFTRDMTDFMVIAANFHAKMAEIVRRLNELGTVGDKALMYQLWKDAALLWAEYQAEVQP